MLLKVYCLFENDYDSSILHAIKSTYKLADEEKNKLIEHERVINKLHLQMELLNGCMIPNMKYFMLQEPWNNLCVISSYLCSTMNYNNITRMHMKHMHSILAEYQWYYYHQLKYPEKLEIEEWKVDGNTWYDKNGWTLRKEEAK